MRRYRQTIQEIEAALLPVEATWLDDHAERVIACLKGIPTKATYVRKDVRRLLEEDFEVGLTVVRLFLDKSKDEATRILRDRLGGGGIGVTRFRKDPDTFVDALMDLGVARAMGSAVNSPLHWSDLLVERLKGGRGSAIKGQQRGRSLEDFVEAVLRPVFGDGAYDVRCRFQGAKRRSTEKADFAIPNRKDPCVLIEAKAYGATGSKQTDVLGDIARIVEEKRSDTTFLLVTDGITWKDRLGDLRKLVAMQNEGRIQRIYTRKMREALEADLRTLKKEFGL